MPYPTLAPDLDAALRFLCFLDAKAVAENRKFIFLWLPPGDAKDPPAQEALTAQDYCKVYPIKLRNGWQPFVCVNAMKGQKRGNDELAQCRAFFLDFDSPPELLPFPLPPHAIVQSRGGQHWYWRANDPAVIWRRTELALAMKFGADLKATDPARVLRMPGSWHLKDPENPYLVTLQHCEHIEQPQSMGLKLVTAFGLDVTAAAARLTGAPAVTTAWTKGDLPQNLKAFLNTVSQTGRTVHRRPGKSEWFFDCPIKKHKSAKVVVILNDQGDWTMFCQSTKECCTRDALLDFFGVTWSWRYSSDKYNGRKSG